MPRALPLAVLILAVAAAAAETATPPPPATTASALAAADLSPEQLKRLLDIVATQRATRTVQGVLVQERRRIDAADGEVDVREARFALEAPDRFSLDYTKPGVDGWRERIASDGEQIVHTEQLDEGIQDTVTEPAKGDRGALYRQVLNFIQMQDPRAVKDYAFAPEATEDGTRLTLTPRSEDAARHVERIVIELDAEHRTRRIRFDDPQGNRVEVTIRQATYNEPIPAGTFGKP